VVLLSWLQRVLIDLYLQTYGYNTAHRIPPSNEVSTLILSDATLYEACNKVRKYNYVLLIHWRLRSRFLIFFQRVPMPFFNCFFGILQCLHTSLRIASELVAVAVMTKYGRNTRERKLSIFQTTLNLRPVLKNFPPYTITAI
jgi:hypothetical protein